MRKLLLLLLLALPAFAAPTITSVSPTSALTFQPTVVTIKGTGFEICPVCSPLTPPAVYFGGLPAQSVELVDSTTIRAVTPRMLPAETRVVVDQWNGNATAAQLFTFTGPPALERILFPAFTGPVRGQFGSEFFTTARAANRSTQEVRILGVDYNCSLADPPLFHDPATQPVILVGRVGTTVELLTDCSHWPGGRFLYVQQRDFDAVTFNLRVHDVSRNAQSNGTEIPVVRGSDFTDAPIVLPGVPIDPRFRALLRVYSSSSTEDTVTVRINDGVERAVRLQPGRDLYEPAYAVFSDFPASLPDNATTFTVTVIPPPERIGSPTIPGTPMWAFITVTNNATQEITTITPQ
ncbi:MAG TPA: IPT/TIG domain-containing protein [Thermoanaerobaculia bacterium]|jgi:hypothetical protein